MSSEASVLLKLYVSTEPQRQLGKSVEAVLSQLGQEKYRLFVFDVRTLGNIAAMDDVIVTPCLVREDLETGAKDVLIKGLDNELVLKRFVLGLHAVS